ncbi:MAG: rod shape-determining protein RodA [Chthonomonadales bacterium]|nr:rod shape-determining protein RodA [Chthonomonadales bacterium]
MIDTRLRKNLDWALVLFVLAIVVIGLATLYSASRDNPGRYFQKQLLWVVIGLGCMALGATIDHARLPRFAGSFYLLTIFLLVLVMVVAQEVKGATRWIPIGSFQFQPSEFAKLMMIVCLATYLTHRQERMHQIGTLVSSFVYVGVPALLIFKQPDLGTALVLIAIWFGMTYIAGARVRHLVLFLAAGAAIFAGMWFAGVLKDYQKSRLVAFVNPRADPKEAGYHVLQSRIAVGSGQLWGKGFRHGTQVQGRFIPESHTDFIFTVLAEEGGFFASALVVLLYGGVLLRGTVTIAQAEDTLGRLLAAGIVSLFAFHVLENIGMTIGIMPVAGVPLPLFSYGGSAMLLNMAAVGVLVGIGMRRHGLVF